MKSTEISIPSLHSWKHAFESQDESVQLHWESRFDASMHNLSYTCEYLQKNSNWVKDGIPVVKTYVVRLTAMRVF